MCGGIYHTSGYTTANHCFSVGVLHSWSGGSMSVSSVTKSGSSWSITVTNTHSSFTAGLHWSLWGHGGVQCTVS